MRLANFTLDQLKVLPLRAIVAFAARCARRVEPLAQLPEGDARGRAAGRRSTRPSGWPRRSRGARTRPRRVGGRGDRRDPRRRGRIRRLIGGVRRRPGGPRGGVRLAHRVLRRAPSRTSRPTSPP